MSYWRFVEHLPYPYNFPLVRSLPFDDFLCFSVRFRHVHTTTFFSHAPALGTYFEYPAPAAMLYLPFEWKKHLLPMFLLVMYSLTTMLWWKLRSYLIRLGVEKGAATLFVVAMYALGYPFWFEAIRANIEIGVFLLLALGVWAYLQQQFYLAAVLFGTVASIKIFPFVFLALFLPARRWRHLAAGIATAAAQTVFWLWVLCPNIVLAYHGIQQGLAKNRAELMLLFHFYATGFDHSIFGFVKSVLHTSVPQYYPSRYVTIYLAIVACAGIALYFGRIVKLPLLNQIVCLYICAVLLPPTSFDYTLLHLYVPWALLLLYAVSRVRAGHDAKELLPAFLCLAVLFAPESELVRHGVLYAAQLKCIALTLLLVIALITPWNGFEQVWAAASGEPTVAPLQTEPRLRTV